MLDKYIMVYNNATNKTQIVAHLIPIPTRVELYRRHLVWSVGLAEYIGWQDQHYSHPAPVFRVVQPAKFAGLTQKALLDVVPEEVRDRVPQEGTDPFNGKLHKDKHPVTAEILISDLPPGIADVPQQKVDGWKMRSEFLRLDRSTMSLVNFLNRYGEWRPEISPRMNYSKIEPNIVFPDEIWYVTDKREAMTGVEVDPKRQLHFHEVIRWGLACEAGRWFRSGYRYLSPHGPRPEFPHFVISVESCRDVILATITLDHLRGTKFRTCARPDCNMPFALESRHKRSYCCQYCAHLESIRRNRLKA